MGIRMWSAKESRLSDMSRKGQKCGKCEGNCQANCVCDNCHQCVNEAGISTCQGHSLPETMSVKIPVKLPESSYVMQIMTIGLRPDNVYEGKILLAPEVDMSSIKITVKSENLRVTAHRPLGDLARQLPGILEKSALGDLVKRTIKHCENFLIPENIDPDKVRAVIDNKQRILILTAPPIRPDKSRRDSSTKI